MIKKLMQLLVIILILGVFIINFSANVNSHTLEKIANLHDIQIGMSLSEMLGMVGEPTHIEPTPYGYEWYIYNRDYHNYFQIGVRDSMVVKIYSNSADWSFKGTAVGDYISDVKNRLNFQDEIVFDYKNSTLTLSPQGSGQDWMYMHYHSKAGVDAKDVIAYYIYDNHNNDRVTSMILGDVESTLAGGDYGYHISWAGDRPEFGPEPISPEMQAKVDETIGYQFQDLINSIRVRKGLHPLDWHQGAAEIAAEHSRDMYYNDFFAHDSPTTGSPGDRARSHGISFSLFLENIAYGRNSPILTHEALMNSLGHRKNILREDITAMGGAGYKNHKYTQKFLIPN